MSLPKVATRAEWLVARKDLLEEWEEPKGRSESARLATPDFSS